MEQIHKRFTAEQVRALVREYSQGILDRSANEEISGIGKSRFFTLLKRYRHGPDKFSLIYQRVTPTRLSLSVEREIEKELMSEKGLTEDPTLPISTYNYSAIKDRLGKRGIMLSSPTIIDRARIFGCYQPHPRKKTHDREVVTTAIGTLI